MHIFQQFNAKQEKKVKNKMINVTFTGNSKIYFSQMPYHG